MDYLDSTLVSKLKFIKRSLVYVDYDFHLRRKFVVHEIDSTSAKKVVALLKGGSRPLQSTDKVFILKDHESRLDDLKEYIKQAGAKVTSKINRATVLLGNNNIIRSDHSYYSNSKYIHVPNGYNIHVNNAVHIGGIASKFRYHYSDLSLDDDSIIDSTAIVYSETYADQYGGDFVSYDNRVSEANADCYLTNYAVSIIYHILSQKLPVLNEHDLVNRQSQNNVIDENSYQVLDGMLKGSTEDILTAQTILYSCNVDKSFYWIKKLAEDHIYTLENKRKKAYKTFLSRLNVTHLSDIAHMTTWDFIKECISRDVFYDNVREGLQQKLDEEIRSDITRRTTREYNDCVSIEYNIDYDKLIEHVKSESY